MTRWITGGRSMQKKGWRRNEAGGLRATVPAVLIRLQPLSGCESQTMLVRNCHRPMIPSTIRLGNKSGAIGGAP